MPVRHKTTIAMFGEVASMGVKIIEKYFLRSISPATDYGLLSEHLALDINY